MARQKVTCPHCNTSKILNSEGYAQVGDGIAHFLFVCADCDKPIVLLAKEQNAAFNIHNAFCVRNADRSIEKCGWRVLDSWPKPHKRNFVAPVGVPPAVGALFEQSKDAASQGAYDLAIMGFYRVLEMAQATISPDKPRKLHPWILSLIESRHVPADMRRWADTVKGLRSDVQDATVGDAEEFGVFVHVLLEQLFGIRSKFASFRNRAAQLQ